MLPSTRRPSPTTEGRASNVESSSTSCATARVAELPEPIATPMSASFSASTSFTPSPVIATTCPRDWSASTIARFCCGVTLPKIACVSSTSASSRPPSGSAFASNGASAPGRPTRRATAATVCGVVAADDLDVHALPGEVRERRRGRLPDPVGQDHEGDRDEPGRRGVGPDRGVGPAEEHHAPSRLGVRARLREMGVVVRPRAEQHVRRAEHPGPPGPEVGAAPLAGGRERDGRGGEPARPEGRGSSRGSRGGWRSGGVRRRRARRARRGATRPRRAARPRRRRGGPR